jgi:hypothetical protein
MAGITVELDPNGGYETMDFLREPEYAAKALELQCVFPSQIVEIDLSLMSTRDYSAEGKGIYRMGITSYTYIPLSFINPKKAPGLIEGVAQKINDAKRDGKLPPGLTEQLDVQLEILRNDTVPDVEIVAVPCHLVAPSECDEELWRLHLMCVKVLPSLARVM